MESGVSRRAISNVNQRETIKIMSSTVVQIELTCLQRLQAHLSHQQFPGLLCQLLHARGCEIGEAECLFLCDGYLE